MIVWSMTITTTILYNHYSNYSCYLSSLFFSSSPSSNDKNISQECCQKTAEQYVQKKNFFFNCLDTKTGRNGAGQNDSTNETTIKQNRIPQKLVSTYWPQI